MKIVNVKEKKIKPDFNNLGFGKYFTDYMLVMEYDNGAWSEPCICPNKEFSLDPSTTCLHYGQGIFEGLKAYKDENGTITMFRPTDNIKRMNNSAKRLCMPELDEKTVYEALKELVLLEKDWIPVGGGRSLYIRPTMIGTEPVLGVHASRKYKFFVILSPVGSYYAHGLAPTKIYVENEYVRAPIGGTGEAKCMGNYAASLLAGELANKKGYDQVLWLDAKKRKNIEEVGSMNMFFVFGKTVVTPALCGSILPGITRDSIIKMLRADGYEVQERTVTIDEVVKAAKKGKLTEAFGSGTAAVVSPVGVLSYKGEDIVINDNIMGPITKYAYDKLTGIQNGKIKDDFGWVVKLN